MSTPARQDKRLWLTVGTIAALVALMVGGVVDGEIGAGALVTLATAYMGQSQWGAVRRSAASSPPTETAEDLAARRVMEQLGKEQGR